MVKEKKPSKFFKRQFAFLSKTWYIPFAIMLHTCCECLEAFTWIGCQRSKNQWIIVHVKTWVANALFCSWEALHSPWWQIHPGESKLHGNIIIKAFGNCINSMFSQKIYKNCLFPWICNLLCVEKHWWGA